MNKPRRRRLRDGDFKDSDVKQVLHNLLERSGNPSRLLEVYYWSTEPELVEFIRQFLALPNSTRFALTAFMSMTKDAWGSVAVTIGLNGEITLSSPAVAEAMKMRTLTSIPHESSESMH